MSFVFELQFSEVVPISVEKPERGVEKLITYFQIEQYFLETCDDVITNSNLFSF